MLYKNNEYPQGTARLSKLHREVLDCLYSVLKDPAPMSYMGKYGTGDKAMNAKLALEKEVHNKQSFMTKLITKLQKDPLLKKGEVSLSYAIRMALADICDTKIAYFILYTNAPGGIRDILKHKEYKDRKLTEWLEEIIDSCNTSKYAHLTANETQCTVSNFFRAGCRNNKILDKSKDQEKLVVEFLGSCQNPGQ